MSLFSVLSVGNRGLQASQLGMDITGQNISNADVEGYSRKRLNMSADYRYDPVYGQMGFGVEVINVERMRDVYIDQQIQRQNQDVGMFGELDNTYESVENILNEPGDTGVMAFVDQFFDSWHNLSNNPADMAARTMVKTNAEILTDVFHNLAGEMTKLRTSCNDQIADRVNSVNSIVKEIFDLNSEIGQIEISNQNANDSRDRRDKLITDLSKIIDVQVIENNIGQISVTTGGNIIVSPVDYQPLDLTTTTFTAADGSTFSDIGIRYKNSSRSFMPTSGQIKGLFESRDRVIPEYQGWLDKMATGLVEKVNEQHNLGYSLMGYSGIDFFTRTCTGAADIEVGASITSDIKNIAAAGGGKTVSQTILPPPTTFGLPATNLGPGITNVVANSIIVKDVLTGEVLKVGIDFQINLLNGDFQLLTPTYNGRQLQVNLDTKTDTFKGTGDNANSIALSALRHTLTMEPDKLGNNTATFDQFYSSFVGRLGLDRQEAGNSLKTREYLIQQYQTHQDSIAGVSLDEEMSELVKFQHTYQAAARIITTAEKMLDILMNI